MPPVLRGIRDLPLPEPTRTHAVALARRHAVSSRPHSEVSDPEAWTAGLEYLASRVVTPEVAPEVISRKHEIPTWRMLGILDELRLTTGYRDYVGQWIREGCPDYHPETTDPEPEDEEYEEPPSEVLTDSDNGIEQQDLELEPEPEPGNLAPPAIADPWHGGFVPPLPIGEGGVPSRWRADFQPYAWQQGAAEAWERNEGRGIMQVVTGAGKTALALFLYARLLDRIEPGGDEVQLIIVVPRIELARQWAREIRQILDLKGLRLGLYHSGSKCRPGQQDILVVTQDSARAVIPRMRFDRPVMLVADECHRLGAPAASRILDRTYSWTLGLSATPERGGDLAFEQVLIPRLGPVVWKYGYRQAVDDGIIARFDVVRVRVRFTAEEQASYDDRTERVKRLLDGIKNTHPVLRRTPPVRFWQVLGDLKKRNPEDSRFDMLQAATAERRDVVHFAKEKLSVVGRIAQLLTPPRRTLCFHERIEAAERLADLVVRAGRRVAIYHSQVPEPVRTSNLSRFRQGGADWLVACKSLDEGLDIPAVDTIVIVAATKSPRQLIQRLGRALRRKGQDRAARVILVEVAGIDDAMLDHDALADLRDAADAVRDVNYDDLPSVVEGGPANEVRPVASVSQAKAPGLPGTSTRATVAGKVSGAVHPPKPMAQAEDEPGVLRRLWRSIVPRSWTGTSGNQSYYDKDSSPD